MDYLKLTKSIKNPVDWNQIKIVVFDCDGVLTDGKIIYSQTDNYIVTETKNFNAHDGMGFSLLHSAGILSSVITGRNSKVLSQRCKDLKIKHIYQGVHKKMEKVEKLLIKLGLNWNQLVYMGDDWNDIPCMQNAAFSFCPADAMPEIKHITDLVTSAKSGDGAVRECIDYILYHKGIYEQVVQQYLQEISE